VWTTHVRRTDAPDVRLDDADHTGRTRRDESARAVSGYAARGTLRIAPATEPARPALPERRDSRIQRTTLGFEDSRIRGFEDERFAMSDQ